MTQIVTVKTIDQYERVYVPKPVMEELGIEKGQHCVWMQDEEDGHFELRKATVTIE